MTASNQTANPQWNKCYRLQNERSLAVLKSTSFYLRGLLRIMYTGGIAECKLPCAGVDREGEGVGDGEMANL